MLYLCPGIQLLLAWPKMSRASPQREAVKKGPGISPRSSKGHGLPLNEKKRQVSVNHPRVQCHRRLTVIWCFYLSIAFYLSISFLVGVSQGDY